MVKTSAARVCALILVFALVCPSQAIKLWPFGKKSKKSKEVLAKPEETTKPAEPAGPAGPGWTEESRAQWAQKITDQAFSITYSSEPEDYESCASMFAWSLKKMITIPYDIQNTTMAITKVQPDLDLVYVSESSLGIEAWQQLKELGKPAHCEEFQEEVQRVVKMNSCYGGLFTYPEHKEMMAGNKAIGLYLGPFSYCSFANWE